MTKETSSATRYFAYSLELLIIYMIQETPHLMPLLFGVKPVLLIPVALTIAIFENEICAMAFGVASGLLIDFGLGSALGMHAILLAVLCYTVSIMCSSYMQINLFTASVTGFFATALCMLIEWLVLFVLSNYSLVGYALTRHYLPKFLYSMLLFPLMYYLNRALSGGARLQEK